jgi:hypothetical protein
LILSDYESGWHVIQNAKNIFWRRLNDVGRAASISDAVQIEADTPTVLPRHAALYRCSIEPLAGVQTIRVHVGPILK